MTVLEFPINAKRIESFRFIPPERCLVRTVR
uniref:Uncharacterized protein n=1 Tax=Amphimedon queenslandica TaxID=400682 RepID=A0A1X7VNB8_AMPQE